MKYVIIFLIIFGLSGCSIQDDQINKIPDTSPSPSLVNTLESVPTQRTGLFEKVTERYEVRGIVTIENGELSFSEDFEISFGPDLFVHFGTNNQYDSDARIARLQKVKGAQTYTIPKGLELSEIEEIWIWCRAFNVGFAKAKLN
ncbi:MAG: hypothetical protein KatS3mg087_0340 [Patescibacteria group bacterium]|nr:MAG: hypothetical protein KatS3mg087_0340 [Patescibacteria group bacterium]